MHIAHIKAGALAAQPARPQRRKGALVRQFGKWIGLLHKLRQLRRAEKLLHSGDNRADIDQRDRRQLLGFPNRHPFLYHAFHAAQADTQFVADQLANGFHAAIPQMVNVIAAAFAVVDEDHVPDQRHNVSFGNGAMRQVDFVRQVQTLIEFVTSDSLQVITALVKQLTLQIFARIVQSRRVAGSHPPIKFNQRDFGNRLLLLHIPFRLVLDRAFNIWMGLIGIDISKQLADLIVLASLDR